MRRVLERSLQEMRSHLREAFSGPGAEERLVSFGRNPSHSFNPGLQRKKGARIVDVVTEISF